jgi:hypothetical protein
VPNPEQERMDALSEAILRLLRRHEQLDQRLARVEGALNIEPAAPPSAPPEPRPLEPPRRFPRQPPLPLRRREPSKLTSG